MSKTRLRRTDPEKEWYWREVVHRQPLSGQSVREWSVQFIGSWTKSEVFARA